MIIRKLYKFEGAHIVRNCASVWCRENIHGHSYKVEFFIESDSLDQGCMVVDFTLLHHIKELVRSFDHAYSIWHRELPEIHEFVNKFTKRVVEMPLSPTAEGYALIFFKVADAILKNTRFKNGEKNIRLKAVRVHETETGYAEASEADRHLMQFPLNDIVFSAGIQAEWPQKNWWQMLIEGEHFENPATVKR